MTATRVISDDTGESLTLILHLQSFLINIQTGGYFGFYWWSDEVKILLNMTILTNITDESHPQIFPQEKILNDSLRVKTLQRFILFSYQTETGKTLTDLEM